MLNVKVSSQLEDEVVAGRYAALLAAHQESLGRPFQIVRDAALVAAAVVGAVSLFELNLRNAEVFALIYAVGVPGIILTMTLNWCGETYTSEQVRLELHILREDYPDVNWPALGPDLRKAGRLPGRKNRYRILAGLVAFPGASLGSLFTGFFALQDVRFFEFTAWSISFFIVGGGVFVLTIASMLTLYRSMQAVNRANYDRS